MDTRSLERIVIDAIGAACRIEAAALSPSTPLVELGLDSLTLVVAVGQIEAACGATFDAGAVAELVGARDVGGLVAAVARML
jgi:acyl carrier protein